MKINAKDLCSIKDIQELKSVDSINNILKVINTVEWGESAKIYTPLFAIVYASFFKYIKLPDEVIKSTLLQIF